MSFGYSVGDCIIVVQLAWKVYKSCRDAPESFSNIQYEVLSLHAVLKEIEESLPTQELATARQQRLATISAGCQGVLNDLQDLVDKYQSLGSKSKRTWDRLRWGSADVGELRARLTSNTMLLTAFISTSQFTVERQLNRLVQEFQEGKHEGSVLTVATTSSISLDEKETWRLIRKEFEDIGISVAAFDANKGFIMKWFHQALEDGVFEEQEPGEAEKDGSEMHNLLVVENRKSSATSSLEGSSMKSRASSRYSADTVRSSKEENGEDLGEDKMFEVFSEIQIPSGATHSDSPPAYTEQDGPGRATPEEKGTSKSEKQAQSVSPGSAIASSSKETPRPTQSGVQNNDKISRKRPPKVAKLFSWIVNYDRQFHEHCKLGNFDEAQLLLTERGVNVDVEYHTETAMTTAAASANKEAVRFLYKAGANIEQANKQEVTPLCAALISCAQTPCDRQGRKPHLAMIEYLLDLGANIECYTGGLTALRLAVGFADPELVELVLNRGAKFESYPNQPDTLLKSAVNAGGVRVVEILLDHGASVDALAEKRIGDWKTMLHYAIECFKDEEAALLIERGATITADTASLLISRAFRSKCYRTLTLLVGRFSAQVEEVGEGWQGSPLYFAVQYQDFRAAKILIAGGAPFSQLYYLCKKRDFFVVPKHKWSNVYLELKKEPGRWPNNLLVRLDWEFSDQQRYDDGP